MRVDWEFWLLKCLEWAVWLSGCAGVLVVGYTVYEIVMLIGGGK